MKDCPLDILPKLPSPDRCCGCSACFAACPHGAIEMKPDDEGFLQPVVNVDLCVECGLCAHVCPVLHPGESRKPIAVYAAKAKDDELRRISSSGGIFSLLARRVLERGGVVYGAAFEPETYKVVHIAVEDEEGLDRLRGSKYVQSDMGDTFRNVKRDLDNGRHVLFSGCPCQVAGLRKFLDGQPENLLLVDVLCHAVPSPKVWQCFLDAQKLETGDQIVSIEPRRKCNWRSFEIAAKFKSLNGIVYERKFPIWYSIFFGELCSRMSCYRCAFRNCCSGADVSIGDFWGIEHALPDMEDELGVSVVTSNTKKGNVAVNEASVGMNRIDVPIKLAIKRNKAFSRDERMSSRRNYFMANITPDNFNCLAHELTDPPCWFVALRRMKRFLTGKPIE